MSQCSYGNTGKGLCFLLKSEYISYFDGALLNKKQIRYLVLIQISIFSPNLPPPYLWHLLVSRQSNNEFANELQKLCNEGNQLSWGSSVER